jgi:hypothetical protein
MGRREHAGGIDVSEDYREWSAQWLIASQHAPANGDIISFYEYTEGEQQPEGEEGDVVVRRIIARVIGVRNTYNGLQPDHFPRMSTDEISRSQIRALNTKTLVLLVITTHGSPRLRRGCVIERIEEEVMASPGVYIRQDRRK